jgi:hypothetical protein
MYEKLKFTEKQDLKILAEIEKENQECEKE